VAVALIVAAGLGERLGASRPKALVELAGQPLVQWSVDVLASMPAIERIVVALPAGVEAPAGTIGVRGGAVRSESVRLALQAAGPGDPVLVHDAARPLLTMELVQATLDAVQGARPGSDAAEVRGALRSSDGVADNGVGDRVDAAIAAAPVTDTIKQAGDGGAVTRTLDRAGLWAVQTPQAFRRDVLERALDVPDEVLAQATDDAWLIERVGGRVVVVLAPAENLKVTTALDLDLAELLLARRRG
jgi:2-C-methyl-D-erythritol 4-phosphate cytidylyltransferase